MRTVCCPRASSCLFPCPKQLTVRRDACAKTHQLPSTRHCRSSKVWPGSWVNTATFAHPSAPCGGIRYNVRQPSPNQVLSLFGMYTGTTCGPAADTCSPDSALRFITAEQRGCWHRFHRRETKTVHSQSRHDGKQTVETEETIS